jgi:hypothetical protein
LIIVGSEDYDSDTAERYGGINRKKTLMEAKRLVNRSSILPDDAHFVSAGETFRMRIWPETRSCIANLVERGLQKPGDFELRFGYHIGIE